MSDLLDDLVALVKTPKEREKLLLAVLDSLIYESACKSIDAELGEKQIKLSKMDYQNRVNESVKRRTDVLNHVIEVLYEGTEEEKARLVLMMESYCPGAFTTLQDSEITVKTKTRRVTPKEFVNTYFPNVDYDEVVDVVKKSRK